MTRIRKYRPLTIPSLMDEFFNNDVFQGGMRSNQTPAVNIKESDNGFELEIAALGFKKEDIKLEVKDNTLTISSEVKEENSETNTESNYTRKEFTYNSFSRSFNLPQTVDQEKIEAKYEAGILSVNIPRKEVEIPKVKQIAIG